MIAHIFPHRIGGPESLEEGSVVANNITLHICDPHRFCRSVGLRPAAICTVLRESAKTFDRPARRGIGSYPQGKSDFRDPDNIQDEILIGEHLRKL